MFARFRNPEPYNTPRTDPPHFSQFPKPPGRGHPMVGLSADTYDDISMDSWPTRHPSSHTTADITMPDLNYTTSGFGHADYSWRPTESRHSFERTRNSTGSQGRQEKNKAVVVTLRDDQLGQIVSLHLARNLAHPTPKNTYRVYQTDLNRSKPSVPPNSQTSASHTPRWQTCPSPRAPRTRLRPAKHPTTIPRPKPPNTAKPTIPSRIPITPPRRTHPSASPTRHGTRTSPCATPHPSSPT
jgi:hypothetical protein